MNDKYISAMNLLIDKDGVPTKTYVRYSALKKEWADKKRDFEVAYEIASKDSVKAYLWPVTGKSYISDVNLAMDQWTSLGFKIQVEQAIELLAEHPSYKHILEKL